MRLETSNLLYDGFETVLETMHEQPIDTEYNLPDYCADIQKILKCTVTPEVVRIAVLGDSLSVDGAAEIRVLYLDQKGECVRGFDMRREFSFSQRLSGSTEGAVASVRPSVQHVTCRAMNARRVDTHVALGFQITVTAIRRGALTETLDSPFVETQSEQFEVSKALGCLSHSFILESNTELQSGKPPIETVLCKSAYYTVDSCTVREGEVAVEGKACVSVLYRTFSDSAQPEQMTCELPFSETIDCAGAVEGGTAQIQVLPGECSVQPREDSVGEYMVLNVYLKPCITGCVTKPMTVRTVCDAFATKGKLETKYKTVPLEQVDVLPPRTLKVKEMLRVPDDDLERVLNIWGDSLSLSAFTEKENVVLRGKFSICLLYQTKEKRIAFLERMFDFTDTLDNHAGGRYSVSGDMGPVRYTITDGGVEFTADIFAVETRRTVYNARTVDTAELDENAACDKCRAAIYYAAAGERVWDVAKRYSVRVQSLRAHNDCAGDTIAENGPVIIC